MCFIVWLNRQKFKIQKIPILYCQKLILIKQQFHMLMLDTVIILSLSGHSLTNQINQYLMSKFIEKEMLLNLIPKNLAIKRIQQSFIIKITLWYY